MTKVLLVDDDPAVLEMLDHCCREGEHATVCAADGRDALRLFFQHQPDVVVLDLMMPVMDGFEVCRRIRDISDVPIIVLSALGREEDKVKGLRLGADDYVVKPVGPRELLARIEAALRRANFVNADTRRIYSDGVLTIHLDRHELFVRGRKVELTPKEMRLLVYLTQRAGKVVSVPQLLTGVWGSVHYSEESVKWHVASLRKKIEDNPHEPKLIVTIWGAGYRYDRPSTGTTPSSDARHPASATVDNA